MAAISRRIDWVDYSKGICILLVVLMHSTLGVEKALGIQSWMHGFIEWARPFRMPDFFLISGLFLASSIDLPWRRFLDSKLIHFGYFYLLWMSIQLLFKSVGIAQESGVTGVAMVWASGLIEPFGTLWFIYLLAIFFVVTKLLRRVPPLYVLLSAAALELLQFDTGWMPVDEFAARFVYFFTGYAFARIVFQFADRVASTNIVVTTTALVIWAICNGIAVKTGFAALPGFGLLLAYCGTAAVISMGIALTNTRLSVPIRYCGQNSIVIYLGFSLFMAATRIVLLKSGVIGDPVVIALLATGVGVVGPLCLCLATRHTMLAFLFVRPSWARVPIPINPLANRHYAWLATPIVR